MVNTAEAVLDSSVELIVSVVSSEVVVAPALFVESASEEVIERELRVESGCSG